MVDIACTFVSEGVGYLNIRHRQLNWTSSYSHHRPPLVPCHQGHHSFRFMSHHLLLIPRARHNPFLLRGSREISNRT